MKPTVNFVALLRAAGLSAAIASAAGSLWFMLKVGHHNQSQLLLALFTIWVLSPFVVLVTLNVIARPIFTPAFLCALTFIISLCSLAIYERVALGPRRAQPAFAFVVVPPASLAITAVAIALTIRINRRRSPVHQSN